MTDILVSLITALGLGIPAYFVYKGKIHSEKVKTRNALADLRQEMELEKRLVVHEQHKINFFNDLMNLTTYSKIKSAAEEIFKHTQTDRFLILIAVNGKDAFRTVSVVMEHHKKEPTASAIGRYHNIVVDDEYVLMLKKAERYSGINLETESMPDCLLRSFYEIENVKHSRVMFLARRALDADNDILVYCSTSTHSNQKFTQQQRRLIQTIVQSTVVTNINKLID